MCLSLSRWFAPTCSCRSPSWWGFPMKKASPWLNSSAQSSSSTSLLHIRNYPYWRPTGWTGSRNSSVVNDSGYLCVDLPPLPDLASHSGGTWAMFFLWQVRSETITTYALCGFANFSSLGIVIGGLCEYLSYIETISQQSNTNINFFFLSKPLYVPPDEEMYPLWCWGPWSPAHVCLSSTPALLVNRL